MRAVNSCAHPLPVVVDPDADAHEDQPAKIDGTIGAVGIPPGSSEPVRVVITELMCD